MRAFIVGLMVVAIVSLPIMLLWNACLVPAVAICNEIGYVQAFGLVVIFQLFGARIDLKD